MLVSYAVINVDNKKKTTVEKNIFNFSSKPWFEQSKFQINRSIANGTTDW